MAEADCAAMAFAVQRGAWSNPELAAMVAPPVIVTAAPVERSVGPWRIGPAARTLGGAPLGRHRQATR